MKLSQSIRETIDFLPGGLCFSTPGGRPVLVNRRMNELIFQLLGHTVMNARRTWEELRQFTDRDDCRKLHDPWLDSGDDRLFFLLPGGSVWRLQREELTERTPHYIQLEATNITQLYLHSKQLYENNRRLAEQKERRQSLLQNIVEINQEKELLSAKMRIHDDLGRSILMTRQHLQAGALEEHLPHLAEIWSTTIRSLEDFSVAPPGEEASPEAEINRAAEMIGCRIRYDGARPQERKTQILFYAAVREALTNAVRHAGADGLIVTTRLIGQGFHVEIVDNGKTRTEFITEGNGLTNLRRRLEQEGGTLTILCSEGVRLMIGLPEKGGTQHD